jgi:xanthine dehydrogenase YagS FAD-binding subunit
METFTFERAEALDAAIDAAKAGARCLGGGTNLFDLMKQRIERPKALVDVSSLAGSIERTATGSLLIGGAVRNTAVVESGTVRAEYPMLARAILSGASGQIRNMATVAGNILQRTRCAYFYDLAASCNKRAPSSGCDAIGGLDRGNAVLGTSQSCTAVHPSDMCVALAALDATVHVEGPRGRRLVPFAEFHREPGDTPHLESDLQAGEMIVAVELARPVPHPSTYRKVRDRASYAFALGSVAAQLGVEGGRVSYVRIALGGVGTRPWRANAAERLLQGGPATGDAFRAAGEAAVADAVAGARNGFKIDLARRLVARTLMDLGEQP